MPVNPDPLPINDPVNDPVVYDAVNALNDDVVTNEPVLILDPPPFIEYEEVIEYDADILYKEPVCNCPGLNCLAIMSTFH